MKFKDFTDEAANPAQQAAIAISMKKAGKKPKSESTKFAGHFKSTDRAPVGKKLVGMESTQGAEKWRPHATVAREPLKNYTEITNWLGISHNTLKALRMRYPGFPDPVSGIRASYGSHQYYRPSEVKKWVRDNNLVDIITKSRAQQQNAVPVPESIQPGDTVRTVDMSRRGIVESVELYRPFQQLAVYFRTVDNQLLRTPITNVVRIPIGE